MRLVGATNLTEPSASIFATFSFRGTELAKTDVVKTAQQPRVPPDDDVEGPQTETVTKDAGGFSHVWPARHSSKCTVPLPEECVDRRETEIEIDLWEEGGPEKEHGDNLGQVMAYVLSSRTAGVVVATEFLGIVRGDRGDFFFSLPTPRPTVTSDSMCRRKRVVPKPCWETGLLKG